MLPTNSDDGYLARQIGWLLKEFHSASPDASANQTLTTHPVSSSNSPQSHSNLVLTMKKRSISLFSKTTPFTLAAIAALSVGVMTETSYAATDVVEQAEVSTSVSVEVPAGGEDVTFTVDDEEVTIKAGTSGVIPAGATNIVVPANTILTLVTKTGGVVDSTTVFKAKQKTTVPNLSGADFSADASFTLVSSSSEAVKTLSSALQSLQNALNAGAIAAGANSDGNE